MTWREQVYELLENLGGHAYLKEIYNEFVKNGTRTKTLNYEASIRDTLEKSTSDSDKYDGSDDLFYMIEGKGQGHYGIRNYENRYVELTQEDDEFAEGKENLKLHIQRERNQYLINLAKKKFKQEHGKLFCEVCGFDFAEVYGSLGENFIEAHHIIPISKMQLGDKTKVEDIVMVCSNCHSMIHRKRPWLNKEEIYKIIK